MIFQASLLFHWSVRSHPHSSCQSQISQALYHNKPATEHDDGACTLSLRGLSPCLRRLRNGGVVSSRIDGVHLNLALVCGGGWAVPGSRLPETVADSAQFAEYAHSSGQSSEVTLRGIEWELDLNRKHCVCKAGKCLALSEATWKFS